MKYLLALCVIALSGCVSTAPVARNFPSIPSSLQTNCPMLSDVPDTEKLSVVLSVVAANYSKYHECRAKVESWMDWYSQQKEIFDHVK